MYMYICDIRAQTHKKQGRRRPCISVHSPIPMGFNTETLRKGNWSSHCRRG